MKFRSLENWIEPENLEGLAFFAQLIEELLFDYSLDTYKPSALNTATLAIEAYRLLGDVDSGLIDAQNLNPVLEELADNLGDDEVAKSLLRLRATTVCESLRRADVNEDEKRTVLEIVISEIALPLYKRENERILKEALADKREKKRICRLTRSYITTLISLGYSTRYLYRTCLHFFFTSRQQIRSIDQVDDLFHLFGGQARQFELVFLVDKIFLHIKDSCELLGMIVASGMESLNIPEFAKTQHFHKGAGPFLQIKGIKALDEFSALSIAEKRLDRLSTLTSLYHHKRLLDWNAQVLIVDNEKEQASLTSAPGSPMHLCSDNRIGDAASQLRDFIKRFRMAEEQSFLRFVRATDMHALALRSESEENQLLNLWIALETLAPSRAGRSKSKIANVIDSIIPFICIDYPYRLTQGLACDFERWLRGNGNEELQQCLNDIEGDTMREKVVKLLLLPGCQDARERIYSSLDTFYLLRNRAHYFSEVFAKTKRIEALLSNHAKRVELQIRRIYRTRNQIVHGGHTPPFTPILIKNAHDYLDIVTSSISRLASGEKRIATVDQAFMFIELKHNEMRHDLRVKNECINSDNIEQLLLSICPF